MIVRLVKRKSCRPRRGGNARRALGARRRETLGAGSVDDARVDGPHAPEATLRRPGARAGRVAERAAHGHQPPERRDHVRGAHGDRLGGRGERKDERGEGDVVPRRVRLCEGFDSRGGNRGVVARASRRRLHEGERRRDNRRETHARVAETHAAAARAVQGRAGDDETRAAERRRDVRVRRRRRRAVESSRVGAARFGVARFGEYVVPRRRDGDVATDAPELAGGVADTNRDAAARERSETRHRRVADGEARGDGATAPKAHAGTTRPPSAAAPRSPSRKTRSTVPPGSATLPGATSRTVGSARDAKRNAGASAPGGASASLGATATAAPSARVSGNAGDSHRASAEDSRETCGYTAVVPKAHPVSGAMCRPETRTTVPPPAKPDAGRTEVASAGLRKWNTAASSPFAADRKPPAPTAKKPSPRNASNAPRPNAENLEDARANVSGEREPSNPSVSPPQVISPWRAISPGADRAPTTHGARSCFRSVAPKTARVRAPAPPDSAVLGTANSTGSAETYSYHTSSSVYPAPVRAPTATRAAPISRAGATHSSVDPPSAAASASRASSGPTLPMRHAAGSTPTKFSPATTITSPPRSGRRWGSPPGHAASPGR